MASLSGLFKNKGMSPFIEKLEEMMKASEAKIALAEQRIKDLELALEINGAIIREGSAIAPAKLLSELEWNAADISDLVFGLDAISYDSKQNATRWATAGVREIKFLLPLDRKRPMSISVFINGGVLLEVVKSLKLHVDGAETKVDVLKTPDLYQINATLKTHEASRSTSLVLRFMDQIDGEKRHTLGICRLEARAVRND